MRCQKWWYGSVVNGVAMAHVRKARPRDTSLGCFQVNPCSFHVRCSISSPFFLFFVCRFNSDRHTLGVQEATISRSGRKFSAIRRAKHSTMEKNPPASLMVLFYSCRPSKHPVRLQERLRALWICSLPILKLQRCGIPP